MPQNPYQPLSSLFNNPQNTMMQNFYSSAMTPPPKAPSQPPVGSTSVGAVGSTGGYDTVPNGIKAKNPINNVTLPTTNISQKFQSPTQQTQKTTSTPQGQNGVNFSGGGISNGPANNPNQIINYTTGQTQDQPQRFNLGGNATTPSGATVDPATGNLVSPPQNQTQSQGILNQLLGATGNNATIGQNANQIAQNYGQQISDVNKGFTGQAVGSLSTGTTPVAQGNAGLAYNAASQRIQGLGTAENAALQGTGQQLTAQQQQQNGLLGALGLSQSTTVAPGQAVFNPVTGQYTSASSGAGNPSTAPSGIDQSSWDNYVNMATNGQYAAIPSSITSNPNLSGQLNAAALAKNPSYSPISSVASGTATTQQIQQKASYQSALQQGQNLQAQLKDLITTFGLNPNVVNAVNAGIQKIASNTSDPNYKQLNNYVNDIANTYAQILTPPGGSSTDTTRSIASSMLESTASGMSIMDVMKSLDNAAQAKIAGVVTNTNGQSTNTNESAPAGFGWDGK